MITSQGSVVQSIITCSFTKSLLNHLLSPLVHIESISVIFLVENERRFCSWACSFDYFLYHMLKVPFT